MDPPNPLQQGIRFGFHSSSFVENMEGSQDEDNLRLLASAASGSSRDTETPTGHASGSGGGAAGGQSESRPGPSGGGVADLFPELRRILRYDDTKPRVRACECGGKHARFQPVCVDVTEDLRPDHLVLACTGAEFGSSGEETD
uniref:E1B-142R n=1 Tax=Human adenovirus B serotype 16 TaxID=31544 RepID=G3FJH6_ADE16|nr:E1B-142R [Human adenovirus 16]